MTEGQGCRCCGGTGEAALLERLGRELEGLAGKPGALIPALQLCQGLLGHVPPAAEELIAERLAEPRHKVHGVVTFYSFFSTVPRGRHTVRVCLGTACYVQGASLVLEALKTQLGVEVGQTTPDRQFTLEVGRCFGACGLAPAVMVGDDVHSQVRPAGVKKLLAAYRQAPEAKA